MPRALFELITRVGITPAPHLKESQHRTAQPGLTRGKDIERGDACHGQILTQGDALGNAQTNAQPRERSRTQRDADAGEAAGFCAGFSQHFFDGGNQLNCMVIFAAPDLFGEHIRAVKNGDAYPFGGCID